MIINPVKTSIQHKCDATFLGAELKKNYLIRGFQLNRQIDHFPIVKVLIASSKRFFHIVHLDQEDEVDEQLLAWIRESYEMICGLGR